MADAQRQEREYDNDRGHDARADEKGFRASVESAQFFVDVVLHASDLRIVRHPFDPGQDFG